MTKQQLDTMLANLAASFDPAKLNEAIANAAADLARISMQNVRRQALQLAEVLP